MAIDIPQVSQTELHDFHQAHFSAGALQHFHAQFLQPTHEQTLPETQESYNEDLEDDDGLGYYPDGVKRTLTDEQIAIFRHSEMEALRRSQTKQTNSTSTPSKKDINMQTTPSASSPRGSVKDTTPDQAIAPACRNKKNKNKQRRREPKPDLRKRTWDIVEPGLNSLEYD